MTPPSKVSPVSILRRARALVFDFDGTLVDSNEIKWRGFEVAFADFRDQLPEIMSYCRQQNHTQRSEKFRHVCERILGLPYTDRFSRVLHERYAAATTNAVVSAPEIPGAIAFLRHVLGRYRTALLSSTPHEVLLAVLERRSMRDYFDGIQGGPVNKGRWLAAFRRQHALMTDQVVFFGDTDEDRTAARASGCSFIAVGRGMQVHDGGCVVTDFRELSECTP